MPENADNSELQSMFEKYGDVKECDIVKNYAFVVRFINLIYLYFYMFLILAAWSVKYSKKNN